LGVLFSKRVAWLLGYFFLAAFCIAQKPSSAVQADRDGYLKIAGEVEGALNNDVLGIVVSANRGPSQGWLPFPLHTQLTLGTEQWEILCISGPHDMGRFAGGGARAEDERSVRAHRSRRARPSRRIKAPSGKRHIMTAGLSGT
jgi:hypothetical protein